MGGSPPRVRTASWSSRSQPRTPVRAMCVGTACGRGGFICRNVIHGARADQGRSVGVRRSISRFGRCQRPPSSTWLLTGLAWVRESMDFAGMWCGASTKQGQHQQARLLGCLRRLCSALFVWRAAEARRRTEEKGAAVSRSRSRSNHMICCACWPPRDRIRSIGWSIDGSIRSIGGRLVDWLVEGLIEGTGFNHRSTTKRTLTLEICF